jgi:hypothetical protein
MMLFTEVTAVLLCSTLLVVTPALAADQSKLKEATQQVESGAKAIGSGIETTAKGIGNTVVEGAKVAGEKLRESSKAAEPSAKSAWDHVKQGASDFGRGVTGFFSRVFSK